MQHYRNPVFGHSSPSAPPSGHLRPGPSAVQDLGKLLQLRPHWSGAIRLFEHVFPSHLHLPLSYVSEFLLFSLSSDASSFLDHLFLLPVALFIFDFAIRIHPCPHLCQPAPTSLSPCIMFLSTCTPAHISHGTISLDPSRITSRMPRFRLYSRDSGPAIVASIRIDNFVQDSRLLYLVLAVYSYLIVIWCVPNLLAFLQPLVYGHGVFHISVQAGREGPFVWDRVATPSWRQRERQVTGGRIINRIPNTRTTGKLLR